MNTATSRTGTPLLVLDGVLPPRNQLAQVCAQHSLTIAADGAALQLRDCEVYPDVIIGDLDSVGPHLHDAFFASAVFLERPDQNEYDGAKALHWLVQQGYRQVTILGSSGGRIDHILNNFSLFARFADRLSIMLQYSNSVGYITGSTLHLKTTPNERISLIPLPSARLTTTGLAWNLNSEELAFGKREGASNKAIGVEASVEVIEGIVGVFHYGESSQIADSR